jgi:hypothetical protein
LDNTKILRGDLVKPFAVVLAAALGVAAIAFVADTPLLVLLAILMLVVAIISAFAFSVRTALQGDFLLPYLAVLAAAVGVAAIGVTAIVFGERGDAPGLVLLGIVLITSVVVGTFAFAMRTAQRSR